MKFSCDEDRKDYVAVDGETAWSGGGPGILLRAVEAGERSLIRLSAGKARSMAKHILALLPPERGVDVSPDPVHVAAFEHVEKLGLCVYRMKPSDQYCPGPCTLCDLSKAVDEASTE